MTLRALWCHPRSASTAFERIMRERGDLDVLHEPFMYDFYLNNSTRMFANFEPDPDHPTDYAAIREMLLERSARGSVFLKDMAYYVVETLPSDPELLGAIQHAFLIRDPAESILSYHKRDPDFAIEEVGLEAQWRLYQAIRDAGYDAKIIQSSDLRASPKQTMASYWQWSGLPQQPNALRWDATVPEGWETVAAWHTETIESGAILPPETGRNYRAELEALGAPFTDYDSRHRPFYDALCRAADAPHQK